MGKSRLEYELELSNELVKYLKPGTNKADFFRLMRRLFMKDDCAYGCDLMAVICCNACYASICRDCIGDLNIDGTLCKSCVEDIPDDPPGDGIRRGIGEN